MAELPDGLVTFLFTDVQGSTRLWEDARDSMMEALRLHDEAIDAAVSAYNGVSVKPRGEGDSRFVVFASASDAVSGSAEMQRRLGKVDWPTPRPLLVRASLHTGQAELELGDYYGSAVNRAARLRAIAHGGQTVMSRATFQVVQDHLPEGVTTTDLGLHRLKDLTRPEHVFQLNVAGLDHSFPPLTSLDAVANNLPEQMTDLIGRETELAEARRLLEQSRLLTIQAPGGTGKTRLAIQTAADLAADYPDGVFFIALADISTSSEILQSVAETVGVALSLDEDPQTQLLRYLEPRRQLLVFDNFEHVSDGALIVSEVLKGAPQIKVIATSRSKLNLTGEIVLQLAGLESRWSTPQEAMQTSGVRLFLNAAQRSKPDMALDPADLEPLSGILRLTGGLPLGILLAAAWVDMLSVAEIAAEIERSLDFLETTAADVPDRHRSIRAVFDYTWKRLSPQEQSTFAALSVFRGGFTREAAEAIAGASLRDLADLTHKSLVIPDPDTGRSSVHELLRQYAQAELADRPERHSEILRAHADYFSDLTNEAFQLFAHGEQSRMLTIVEEDLDNIRPAWRHHVATHNAVGVLKMVQGLWIVYEIRGWYQAGLVLFGEALEASGYAGDADDASVVARGYVAAIHGTNLALMGQSEAALATALESVRDMRAAGSTKDLSFALQLEAQSLLYLGHIDEVPVVVDESIALGDEAGSSWPDGRFWAAGVKNLAAFVDLATGNAHQAARLLEESRAVLEPLDELYYLTWNLGHRARLALKERRRDDAIDLLQQSSAKARQLGYLRGLQLSLVALGDATLLGGEAAAARESFVESLSAAERTSMVPELLGSLVKIARVLTADGRAGEAVQLLATVLSDPASDQQLFTDDTSIRTMAASELERLRHEMLPEEYEAAHRAGSARSSTTAAKELIGAAG